MENILGILARLNKEYEDSTNKHIAKVILDNYSQGKFLTLKQLADEAHYSESLMTIFCKRLGFSGYRQFNEYLKIEYHKYYAPVDKSENIEINTEEMLEKYTLFFQDIKDNALFFWNLISRLKKTKKLLILSSYQSHNVSQFIANLLNGKGYECKVYNPSENSISAADYYLEKESVVLCFLTGSDNDRVFQMAKKKKIDQDLLFFITTNGQKEKTEDYKNRFIIVSHHQYNDYFYRTVLLETLSLIIFDKL